MTMDLSDSLNEPDLAGPSRLHIVARVLALCMTSVSMVMLGNVMLALPQIREALWAFDDGTGDELVRQWAFGLAFLYWAATTWYVARLTLGRRFKDNLVGTTSDLVQHLAKWVPRLLAMAACLPVAVYMLTTGKQTVLGLVLVCVSLAFLLFTWKRRALMPVVMHGKYYRYYTALQKDSWATLIIGFAIPHLILLAIYIEPISVPRFLGAPALMLFGMGAWTLVAGMLFSYWPRSKGWVSCGWLLPVIYVACSFVNVSQPFDWHAGRRLTEAQSGESTDERPSLEKHYLAWIESHPAKEPVYLIASAGGASRASYWGGVLLGRLEDEARANKQRFGGNIFMMSGISGGSVGIAAYAAALRAWPSQPQVQAQPCFRLAMDSFLSPDVLAPIGAMMLYPDFLLHFVPLQPIFPGLTQRLDRSRGLEQAWAQDWRAMIAMPPKGCPQPQVHAADLWTTGLTKGLKAVKDQPVLVLNTVRLEDSRRVLQTNVRLDLRDTEDLLSGGLEPRASVISLAGAAHNSARFPFVSPPGSVFTARNNLWGHLGDGGYHEATGASTLADVLEELIELGCLRREPPRNGDLRHAYLIALKTCGQKASDHDASRVVVIFLDNTPQDYPDTWRRDLAGKPRTWRSANERAEIMRANATLRPVELLGPALGLLSHSRQEARSATERLMTLAGTEPQSVIELKFPRYLGVREPSMNWQLDADSRMAMMCAGEPAGSPQRPILSVNTEKQNCADADGSVLPRREGRPANLADTDLMNNLNRLLALIKGPLQEATDSKLKDKK